MKKALLLSLFLAFWIPLNAQTAKLSPSTRRFVEIYQKNPEATPPQGYVYKKSTTGAISVSAMVKVSDAQVADSKLREMGVTIGTKAGAIWTLRVPIQKVVAFTKCEGIQYIELDQPLSMPKLDYARASTGVDTVQMGLGLPMPYTGKDVVIGIIDFGFDYGHPCFLDSLGGKLRIKKVWELNGVGTPPAGYSYGRELADSNAIKAATTDNSAQTHGTMVAGMALGSGYGSTNSSLRGMAYNADAVLVGVRRDSIAGQWLAGGFSDFADGIAYIFNYAHAVGKPAVVNISWGSHSGPHDGSSLFNQACDALAGPGKIIVMSAGNEGTSLIHTSKTFTPADSMLRSFVLFSPANYQRTWLDAWGDTGKTWCADAILYRNGLPVSTTASVCLDNNNHSFKLVGTNNDTCYVDFLNSLSEYNDKPRMTVDFFNKTTDTLRITFRSTSGSIDVWDEYYYYGYDYKFQSWFSKLGQADAVDGDVHTTISDMGSAKSVLLVGAYVTRRSWIDITGAQYSYSASYAPLFRLAPFSSRGPYVDGRVKPDITAPGLTIATSVSSYDTAYAPGATMAPYLRKAYTHTNGKVYYYGEFSGTSAAAPAASGIVALMLQMKPDLTPAQVQSIIKQTARQDVYTGTIPATGDVNWGWGKINAYAAMKQLASQVGVPTYAGAQKIDCTVFPNPGNGSMQLHYNGTRAEDLRVELFDAKGSLLKAQSWPVTGGLNVLPVSSSGLPAGNYLVRVSGKSGSVSIKTVVN
jgi:hypothetical protein